MEDIGDHWKGIFRGVTALLCSTVLFATQTTLVKWGANIGYTASVILIFRGAVQTVFCLVESTITTDKVTKKRTFNLCGILDDIKSIGILPRRTKIPLINDSPYSKSYQSGRMSPLSKSLLAGTGGTTPITPKPASPNTEATPGYLRLNFVPINDNGTNGGQITVIENENTPRTPRTPHTPHTPSFAIKKRKPRTKSYKCLIWTVIMLRGLLGGVGTWLQFEGNVILSVGDMQAFMSVTAVITPIFAFIVFRDKLSLLHGVSILGAICGVTLIVQPPFIFSESEKMNAQMLTGLVYTMLSCCSLAAVYICLQFARKVPVYILTLVMSIMCIVTGVVALAGNGQLMSDDILWVDRWSDMGYIMLVGCNGYCFLWLLTYSGRYLPSGVVALLLNLSIVWGYISQIAFFGVMPTMLTMIGAVCMFLSAVVVSFDKVSSAKRKSQSHISPSIIERSIAAKVGM